MYEFRCGSPVCKASFTAPTKDELMSRIATHVATRHHVPKPSKSLVQFIEANTIRRVPTAGGVR
jgi:predicted small metal-binding protein